MGGGGGWVAVVNPPLYMLLGSYCSLEKPLKKGSPPLALAHYVFSVCVGGWVVVLSFQYRTLERVPGEASAASNHINAV